MNFRQRRKEIEAQLEVVSCEVWQEQPYTAIKLTVRYADGEYELLGFSKVHWPDRFDPDFGIELAKRKAIAAFSKGKALEQELLPRFVHIDSPETLWSL